MATYLILSRITPEAVADPDALRALSAKVADRVKKECPGVLWKASFATLGRFDAVDIIEADQPEQVEKASVIIRGVGRSMTETLLARPWQDFLAAL